MPSAEVDDADVAAYFPNKSVGLAAAAKASSAGAAAQSTAIVGKQEFGIQRHSNMGGTRREERIGVLSSESQAVQDLTPWFKEKGVEKHVRKVAKALTNNSHRTYGNAMEGLAHWKYANFEHYDNIMGGSLSLTVGDRGLITQAINAYKDHVEPPPVPTKLIIRVKCNEIELKLTLAAKFLAKPLAEALLTPFLSAYSKKALKGPAVLGDVKRVRLGEPGRPGDKIKDWTKDVASLIVPHHKYLAMTLKDGSSTFLQLTIKLAKRDGEDDDEDEPPPQEEGAADGEEPASGPTETPEEQEARRAAKEKAAAEAAAEEERRKVKLATELKKAEEAKMARDAEAAMAAREAPEDALSALDITDVRSL